MSKEIQIFKNEQFGEVRTLTIDNEPYFVGKDVAEILGYAKPQNAISTHVDEDDTLKQGLIDSLGRIQQTIVINESGLYSLILSSKLPNAKKFKRWVTSEVLPAIRKTGSYNRKPLTAIEQLQLQGQAIIEVNDRMDKFENESPLFKAECDELQDLVKSTGVKFMGGKSSQAYKDNSIRGKVYSDIQQQLKREFGVKKYSWIKRMQFEKAKEIIRSYSLPIYLADEINKINNQVSFEGDM